MYAHISGIPVEEAVLGLAPVGAIAVAGLLGLRSRIVRFVRSHLQPSTGTETR
jgi:hypothetical protein